MLFWLVVHGSYGPGGSDHERLERLEGTWHAGSFSALAGERFGDLVLKRYQDEPVRGWALQVAPKPDKPGSATEEHGNTPPQMFETWAAIDQYFDDDVIRMDTTFQFDERHPAEGDICRANTYGSAAMIPDGRYDAPHPEDDQLARWRHVVAGDKHYDPNMFAGLLTDMSPTQYGETFADLERHEGFVDRLRQLVNDQMPGANAVGQFVDFSPQPHNAVDDHELLELAEQVLQAKSDLIGGFIGSSWAATKEVVAALQYRFAETGDRPELGDVHYDLAEYVADACTIAGAGPWSASLGHACYALANSYDLTYWLTQDWSEADADLEPLYWFWRAGGSVVVDIQGVAHVSTCHTR